MRGNVIAVTWSENGQSAAFALINPGISPAEVPVPEGWEDYTVLLQGDVVTPEGAEKQGSSITALPRSVTLILRK